MNEKGKNFQTEISMEEFQKILRDQKGNGDITLRFGLSLYRKDSPAEPKDESIPDILVLAKLSNLTPESAEMIWNTLFCSAIDQIGFLPYHMTVSEEEKEYMDKKKAAFAKDNLDIQEPSIEEEKEEIPEISIANNIVTKVLH
jgi:hypothetical protein